MKKHNLSINVNSLSGQIEQHQIVSHMNSKDFVIPEFPEDKISFLFGSLVVWIVDDRQTFTIAKNVMFQRFVYRLHIRIRVHLRRTIGRGVEHGYSVAR